MLVLTSLPINALAELNTSDSSTTETTSTDTNTTIVDTENINQPEFKVSSDNHEIVSENNKYEAPTVEKSTDVGKEISSLGDENSNVYLEERGKYKKEIFGSPIKRKVDGKWKTISAKLVENPLDMTLNPQETLLKVKFNKKMKNGDYVSFKVNDHIIKYKFLGSFKDGIITSPNDVDATYEENKVFYNNVLDSVSIRNIVFDGNVKEDIILDKYNGINSFAFEIKTSLELTKNEDGSIVFKEGTQDHLMLPKPFMQDSNINEESNEPAKSENVNYDLKSTENGYILTVVADDNWLKSSERKYPVYIDPTTTYTFSGFSDAFVASAYPTTNYNNFWDSDQGIYVLKVGYYDGSTGTNYAYLKQDISKLNYANVSSSTFSIFTKHSYYPTTATGVWMDKVSANWADTTINWNNKPSSTAYTSTTTYKGQWAHFNTTNLVNSWIDNGGNYGVKLHTNGNGMTYWKKFYSSYNSSYKPQMVVHYNYNKPATPTAKSFSYDGTGEGYLDINWPSVTGATGYKVWIYNGDVYESFDVGNVTSWTTKGKYIWPKSGNDLCQTSNSTLCTQLKVDPRTVYRAAPGLDYANNMNYAIRISVKYPGGESDLSEAAVPVIPNLSVPKEFTAKAYSLGNNVGFVNLSWKPVTGASGYKVWIFNGSGYQAFDAGNSTTWTSKDKKIWPKDSELAGTTKVQLHNGDGLGQDFTTSPYKLYLNHGNTTYQSNKNYWILVSSYITGVGESVQSGSVTPTIPALTIPTLTSSVATSGANTGTGYVNLSWPGVIGATKYQVAIFNGNTYNLIDVGTSTSFTTKGKKLWPSSTQISNGQYNIRVSNGTQIGDGVELPDDPSSLYKINGNKYPNNINYWFRVIASNGNGETYLYSNGYTPTVPDSTKPNPPTGINVTNQDREKFTISWTAGVDNKTTNNSGVVGYRVTIGSTPGGSDIANDVYVTSTSYVSTKTLNHKQKYYIRVKSVDRYNNFSDYSPEINLEALSLKSAVINLSNLPSTMQVNTSQSVDIEVLNDGLTPWTSATGFKLHSADIDGIDDLTGLSYLSLAAGESIPTGAKKTFTVTLNSKNTIKDIVSSWIMKQNNEKFGTTTSKKINVYDLTKPIASFNINDNSLFTTNSTIELDTEFTAGYILNGTESMSISNDGVSYSAYSPITSPKTWALSSGDGIKEIYVKYKDKNGFEYSSQMKEITLDSTKPVANLNLNENQVLFGDYKITGTASDTNLSEYKVEYGKGETPTTWDQAVPSNLPNTLASIDTNDLDSGYYKVKLTVTDKAGNTSSHIVGVWIKGSKMDLGQESYWDYGSHSLANGSLAINLSNRNYMLSFSELNLLTHSILGYSFDFTYNSNSKKSSILGSGWTFAGNETLTQNSVNGSINNIVYTDEDGTEHYFFKDQTTGNFVSPKGKYLHLYWDNLNNSYILEDVDGFKKKFESFGSNTFVLKSYSDNVGNKILFNYVGSILDNISEQAADGSSFTTAIKFNYDLNGRIDNLSYADLKLDFNVSTNGDLIDYKLCYYEVTEECNNPSTFTREINESKITGYIDPRGISRSFNEDFSTTNPTINITEPSPDDSLLNDITTYEFLTASTIKIHSDDKTIYKKDLEDYNNVIYNITDSKVSADPSEENNITAIMYDVNYNVTEQTVETLIGTVKKAVSNAINTYNNYGKILTSKTYGNKYSDTDNDPSTEEVLVYDPIYESIYSYYENDKDLKTEENIKTEVDSNGVSGIQTSLKLVSYDYYTTNSLLKFTTSNNETTSYEYNTNGKPTKTTYSTGLVESIAYNYSTNGYSVTSSRFEDGVTKQYSVSYDQYENVTSKTDAKGYVTGYKYNPLNDKLEVITDAKGNPVSYEYDQNGNLKEVTTSRATKSFTYNSNNEVESSIYPVTESKNMLTSYNYTADGDVDIITKQSGRQINYDYNEDNELSNIYFTKPDLPTKSWTYNYDVDKKLKSISNGEGTQSKIFNYNTEGELSQIIDRNVELGYDSDEATKTSNYFLNFTPNQYSTTHSTILNSENKVESILFTYGDAKQNKDTYTYSKNADGTSTETTNYGSSPDNTSSLFSSSRLLDKANKPKEIKYVKDGVEFDKWSYDYDLNGNIDKEYRNGVLTEYKYDAINQLEKEIYSDGTELSYTYDEVGNRKAKVSTVNGVSTTEATFTYNLANQILTKNGFAYTYDDDGNLLKDENYDYVYDASGRLAEVKKHDGTLVASYDYDENGLRTKKTIGNIETEYYYSNSSCRRRLKNYKSILLHHKSPR
ncbi:MAG: cell wall-associated protein precursor [Bacillales bacterium]|nr:cell wall-associated protein precursor [Bacillales bacterium]